MKATFSMASLLLALSSPFALAQTELAIANVEGNCPNCSAKQQQILKLKSELAALRGASVQETAPTTEEPPIAPVEEAVAAGDASYTVQPGDGLMKIARKTGCSTEAIAAVNGLTLESVIHPGQVLKLPSGAKTAIASAPATPQQAPAPKIYTIQDGDTYYSLSRRLKIPLDELMAANPDAPATRLYTGRKIKLPVAGAEAAIQDSPKATTPAPAAKASSTPEPTGTTETVASSEPEAATEPAPASSEKKIVAVTVNEEISYADFASKYGTDIGRLNSLNDLTLTSATILAKGSELYVPTQAQP